MTHGQELQLKMSFTASSSVDEAKSVTWALMHTQSSRICWVRLPVIWQVLSVEQSVSADGLLFQQLRNASATTFSTALSVAAPWRTTCLVHVPLLASVQISSAPQAAAHFAAPGP